MAGRKKAKILPVRTAMCESCPFRPDGWRHVRPMLEERALTEASPICHSTGKALTRHKGEKLKAHICRGARNYQIKFFHSIGFIAEPTDKAWAEKVAQLQGGRID